MKSGAARKSDTPPDPAILALARALARQAAREDYASNRDARAEWAPKIPDEPDHA
jgi:hypothetical protein